MTISVSDVPYKSATSGGNDAEALVIDKYNLMQGLVDHWNDVTKEGIEKLTEIYETAAMPEYEINWNFISAGIPSISKRGLPEIPDLPALNEVDMPSIGDLKKVSIQDIVIPEYQLPADPEASYSYFEPMYSTPLLEALVAKLHTWVIAGGTGLDADIEAAIWARAKAKLEMQRRTAWDNTLDQFASRGFTIPPGALAGGLANVQLESDRAHQQLNYEISIEQARLAQNNTQFTVSASTQLENTLIGLHNNFYNRALQNAKQAVDMIFSIYSAKINAYITKLRGHEIRANVQVATINAANAYNSNTVQIFQAKVTAYQAQLQTEMMLIENIGRVFSMRLAGYQANLQVEVENLKSRVEEFRAKVQQANNHTQLSLQEAQMILSNYLQKLTLQSGAAQALGNLGAQITASALSSVNTSASIGESMGKSFGVSHSYGFSLGNSKSVGESHSYEHSAA